MATTNTLALPTISSLRHLEPRPGGQWAVTGQSADSYSLAYIMNGGADAICFTMQACATEEDVRVHCGSLIYSYSEDNITNGGVTSASEHAASGGMHLALRAKQDDSNVTGLDTLALDPLMINPIPESQNAPHDSEQLSQFGVSQTEAQNNMFDLSNGSANNQNQHQMMSAMNGNMNWSTSEAILAMTQHPEAQGTIISGPEHSNILSDMWGENFGRPESLVDGTTQSGWSLQFATS